MLGRLRCVMSFFVDASLETNGFLGQCLGRYIMPRLSSKAVLFEKSGLKLEYETAVGTISLAKVSRVQCLAVKRPASTPMMSS